MKIIIQSIKKYFAPKKKKKMELIFFEKIGDKKTTREEMEKNLINVLKKNGFKIKD